MRVILAIVLVSSIAASVSEENNSPSLAKKEKPSAPKKKPWEFRASTLVYTVDHRLIVNAVERSYVINANTGEELQRFDKTVDATASPDGKILVITFETPKVDMRRVARILDRASGKEIANIPIPGIRKTPTFSEDGRMLLWIRRIQPKNKPASSIPVPTLFVYHADGKEAYRLADQEAFGTTADGKLLTAQTDGSLSVRDLKSGKVVHSMPDAFTKYALAKLNYGHDIRFSPDGKQFATVEKGQAGFCDLCLRETETAKVIRYFEMAQGPVFSPDGKYLAFAGVAEAHVWDLKADKKLLTMKLAQDHFFRAATFSTDSKKLYIGDRDVIRRWHIPSGEIIK
jgi:WD40 repeat protein